LCEHVIFKFVEINKINDQYHIELGERPRGMIEKAVKVDFLKPSENKDVAKNVTEYNIGRDGKLNRD
jgi:hypothetical protein